MGEHIDDFAIRPHAHEMAAVSLEIEERVARRMPGESRRKRHEAVRRPRGIDLEDVDELSGERLGQEEKLLAPGLIQRDRLLPEDVMKRLLAVVVDSNGDGRDLPRLGGG